MSLITFEPQVVYDAARCDIHHPKYGLCVMDNSHKGYHKFCYEGQCDHSPPDIEQRCRGTVRSIIAERPRIVSTKIFIPMYSMFSQYIIPYPWLAFSKYYVNSIGKFIGTAKSVLDVNGILRTVLVVEGADGRIIGWETDYVIIFDKSQAPLLYGSSD